MKTMQARWLSLGLMTLAVVLMLIGLAGGDGLVAVMTILGLIAFAASCVVQFAFHRCPHCGRFLDRNFWGEHCQYCGNRLAEKKQ